MRHIGTFFVFGCSQRWRQASTKTCPDGHVFMLESSRGAGRQEGQGCRRTRKTCETSFVFRVLGGVRGQVRAGRQPSTKNVPTWACFRVGLLGTRARAEEPPNMKNVRVLRVFCVRRVQEL